MELLTSPKAAYLLEADLEVLHEESREWLNELSFWRDEIAFFYLLMIKKVDKNSSDNKSKLTHIQDELLRLSDKEFKELETNISEHERYLASLFENNSLADERSFREKHRVISFKIHDFEKQMRELKREIFAFVTKRQNLTI